jgi:hypothetical protein
MSKAANVIGLPQDTFIDIRRPSRPVVLKRWRKKARANQTDESDRRGDGSCCSVLCAELLCLDMCDNELRTLGYRAHTQCVKSGGMLVGRESSHIKMS